jgi:hypothetical protein
MAEQYFPSGPQSYRPAPPAAGPAQQVAEFWERHGAGVEQYIRLWSYDLEWLTVLNKN